MVPWCTYHDLEMTLRTEAQIVLPEFIRTLPMSRDRAVYSLCGTSLWAHIKTTFPESPCSEVIEMDLDGPVISD